MKIVHIKLFLVVVIVIASFVTVNSLGCNYEINFTDNDIPYTGFCRLGRVVLHYKDEAQNDVRIEGLNIATFSQFLVYITEENRTMFGDYDNNDSIEEIPDYSLLAYGYHRLSKSKVLLFTGLPNERFFIADIKGNISLYDSIVSSLD
ncbi:hypothetical protein [Vibrio mediterranei]|uniref:hypothetical protein n=1 Tax=Vibrio mediterranei TaxID=689 RepID=UPI00148DE50F|nr:hypothetical protein [Vibrio mediterranei]NOI25980.1 hypothetical protein [Vibrio mediterranei]